MTEKFFLNVDWKIMSLKRVNLRKKRFYVVTYMYTDCVVVWVIVRVCSVVLRRTVVGVDWRFDNLSGSHHQSMASAQVVETSINTNNSPSQDYTTNPDNHSNHNIDSPGFKPFTVIYTNCGQCLIMISQLNPLDPKHYSMYCWILLRFLSSFLVSL